MNNFIDVIRNNQTLFNIMSDFRLNLSVKGNRFTLKIVHKPSGLVYSAISATDKAEIEKWLENKASHLCFNL